MIILIPLAMIWSDAPLSSARSDAGVAEIAELLWPLEGSCHADLYNTSWPSPKSDSQSKHLAQRWVVDIAELSDPLEDTAIPESGRPVQHIRL